MCFIHPNFQTISFYIKTFLFSSNKFTFYWLQPHFSCCLVIICGWKRPCRFPGHKEGEGKLFFCRNMANEQTTRLILVPLGWVWGWRSFKLDGVVLYLATETGMPGKMSWSHLFSLEKDREGARGEKKKTACHLVVTSRQLPSNSTNKQPPGESALPLRVMWW